MLYFGRGDCFTFVNCKVYLMHTWFSKCLQTEDFENANFRKTVLKVRICGKRSHKLLKVTKHAILQVCRLKACITSFVFHIRVIFVQVKRSRATGRVGTERLFEFR